MKQQNEQKLFDKVWFIVLMIIFLWPFGLYLLWRKGGTARSAVKWIGIGIAVLVVIYFILGMFTDLTPPDITIDGESTLVADKGTTLTTEEIINKSVSSVSDNETEMSNEDITINGYKDIDFNTEGSYSIEFIAVDEAGNETKVPFTIAVEMTEAQKEAEAKAEEEAAAKEQAKADEAAAKEQAKADEAAKEKKDNRENEKALKTANNYLNTLSFSEQGLRSQLEFEGFTTEQIDYAIENVDADYNAEAVESATNYSNTLDMSAASIYDQLIFEGYTAEQAQYGIDNY